MKNIRTYFRAIKDYRKNTDKIPECVRERTVISESCRENEQIETERVKCTINTDWVEEIEKGLVFVEKALREERQFIRANGEIVPIEKAKNISRSSVEHLAKHSDLITRYDEDEDLTPDKLYTVEKLSDYSVYENRFLYMMLCYLRDFVSLRYSLILEAVNTYKGCASINKVMRSPKGELNFKMELSEVAHDDEYLSAHNEAKAVLDRIDTIYKTVNIFLSYPLMQEVKKSPMIKPPVTKTNVLKMNFNFKGALALYEYISAYNGDGYTLEKEIKSVKGFRNSVADDFAELIKGASFLTYEYGLDIREYLKGEFEKEELERKAEEQRKLAEQIELLKKRVKESGLGMEEYVLLVEKRNKALQEDSDQLEIERKKNEELTDLIADKNKKIGELDKSLAESREELALQAERHAGEIAELNNAHEEYVQKLKEEHEQTMREIMDEHAKAVEKLNAEHEAAVNELKERQKKELAAVTDEYERKILELNDTYSKQIAAAEQARVALEGEKDRLSADNAEKQSEIASLSEERTVLKARINGLKHKYGAFDGNENFSDKENFDEIEEQYIAFEQFFKSTWGKTKKAIRKKSKDELKERLRLEKQAKKDEDKK